MLYYNIKPNQVDRPASFVPVSARRLGAAVVGSFGLHVLAIAAMFADLSAYPSAVDAGASIAVYIEPDAGPVATAHESIPPAAPAPESPPPAAPAPEAEAVAAADPPKEASLPDFEPAPPEALAPPEFAPPPSPPQPKPAPAMARPAPPQPAPKPEPKRPPPAVAASAPAQPGVPPSGTVSPVPAPATTASAPATTVPGWNALLAAWLAANRRYPDEADTYRHAWESRGVCELE